MKALVAILSQSFLLFKLLALAPWQKAVVVAAALEQLAMLLEKSLLLLEVLAMRVVQLIRLFQRLFGWLEQQDMRL